MSKNVTQSLLNLAVAIAFSPTLAHADPPSQHDLLEAGRATLVSQIESELPPMPIQVWLSSLAGPGASFSWELNDCGEQTGIPEIDAERDLPICSSVTVSRPAGPPVYVNFLVGTESRGAVKETALYFAGVLGGERHLSFRTLVALATHLRQEEREVAPAAQQGVEPDVE